jgi:hypothetical protein
MTRTIDLSGHEATVDITIGSSDQYTSEHEYMYDSGTESISLNGCDYGVTLGSNVSVTGIGVPWTTTGTSDTFTMDSSWNRPASGKIKLDGPEADIEVNGQSLIIMLRNIEQRLNILQPNPELESEWAELRELGDQYRTLEAKIQAKMKTWNAVSK